jgi:hypothetical protein
MQNISAVSNFLTYCLHVLTQTTAAKDTRPTNKTGNIHIDVIFRSVCETIVAVEKQ